MPWGRPSPQLAVVSLGGPVPALGSAAEGTGGHQASGDGVWPVGPHWVPSAIQQCPTGHPALSSCAILGAESHPAMPYWAPSPVWLCCTGCHMPPSMAQLGRMGSPVLSVLYWVSRPDQQRHTGCPVLPSRAVLVAQLHQEYLCSAQFPAQGAPVPHLGHLVPTTWSPVPGLRYPVPSARSRLMAATGAQSVLPSSWSWPPHPGTPGTQDRPTGSQ